MRRPFALLHSLAVPVLVTAVTCTSSPPPDQRKPAPVPPAGPRRVTAQGPDDAGACWQQVPCGSGGAAGAGGSSASASSASTGGAGGSGGQLDAGAETGSDAGDAGDAGTGIQIMYEHFTGYGGPAPDGGAGAALAPLGGTSGVCSSGCFGLRTGSRAVATASDGSPQALGDSAPGWYQYPGGQPSYLVADDLGTLLGVPQTGLVAVRLDGTKLSPVNDISRIYGTILTAAGSPAASAHLTGTALDLAGQPFIERGTTFLNWRFRGESNDTSNTNCGIHLQRGVGAVGPAKPDEVMQLIDNTNTQWPTVCRTLGGTSAKGAACFYASGPVIGKTPHDWLAQIDLQDPGDTACTSPDSTGAAVTCPACPPSAPNCYAGVRMWLDGVPVHFQVPGGTLDRVVLANLTNYQQATTIGGWSTIEAGCATGYAPEVPYGHLSRIGVGTTEEAARR